MRPTGEAASHGEHRPAERQQHGIAVQPPCGPQQGTHRDRPHGREAVATIWAKPAHLGSDPRCPACERSSRPGAGGKRRHLSAEQVVETHGTVVVAQRIPQAADAEDRPRATRLGADPQPGDDEG